MRHSIIKCWQLSLTRVSDDDVLEEVRVGHLPLLARWSGQQSSKRQIAKATKVGDGQAAGSLKLFPAAVL